MNESEMTKHFREESPRLKARIAGGLWLLCILAGILGFIAAGPLTVANNAAATAANILANESLFRLGVAANLTLDGRRSLAKLLRAKLADYEAQLKKNEAAL